MGVGRRDRRRDLDGFFAGKWAARDMVRSVPWTPQLPFDIRPPEIPQPDIRPETPERPEFRFIFKGGAVIREVMEDSPADEAGIRPGNIITAVDGRRLTEDFTLAEAIGRCDPEDRVEFTIWDHGRSRDVTVRLGRHPDDPDRAYLGVTFTMIDIPDMPGRSERSDDLD